jgi:hypothetical protein
MSRALTDETGFATVPWDVYTANDGDLDGLPDADWPDFDGPCCTAEWRGPTDLAHETPWSCCLPPGHSGTHRGSDSVSVVAEWRTEP